MGYMDRLTDKDIVKMKRNLHLRGFTSQEKATMRRIVKAYEFRKKKTIREMM